MLATKGYRAGQPDTPAAKVQDGQHELPTGDGEEEEESEEEQDLDPNTPEGAFVGASGQPVH